MQITHRLLRRVLTAAASCATIAVAQPLASQTAPVKPETVFVDRAAAPFPAPPDTQRSGPRIGVAFLGSAASRAHTSSVASVFAWQSEKVFAPQPGGAAGVTDAILAVVGADQGAFLPSFSWLIGVRTKDGLELGTGPNASLEGMGLMFAIGHTTRVGSLFVPFTVDVITTKNGARANVTTGFNMAR